MAYCSKCGKEIAENASFCSNCGATVSQEDFSGATVILNEEKISEVPQKAEIVNNTAPKTKDSGKKKKIILLAAICVLAVAATAVALFFLFSPFLKTSFASDKNSNYLLYMKDKEIMLYNNISSNKDQVTTDLFNYSISDIYAHVFFSAKDFVISKNGEYVYFPDKVSENYSNEGCSIYYKKTGALDSEATKIDSGITTYDVSDDGYLVTYLKGEDKVLYQYDIRKDDKEKIGSDLMGYYVSSDGTKLGYMTNDGDLYLKYAGKDKEKIESGVSYVVDINKDFSVVYYVKDDAFYKMREGEDREKIDSDISRVMKIYDTGEIFYMKSETTGRTLMDYVEDDLAESDASITKPETLVTPRWWYYDTTEEYEAAYSNYLDNLEGYNAKYEEYNAKVRRDNIRSTLRNTQYSDTVYSLYYYDGKEKKELTDNFVESDYSFAENSPVAAFYSYNDSEYDTVKMSEFTGSYYTTDELRYIVSDSLDYKVERYVVCSGNIISLGENENTYGVTLSDKGKTLYYMQSDNDADFGDLYKCEVFNDKIGEPVLYDSDVDDTTGIFLWGNLVYFKDVDANHCGDLYVNGKVVDYDVSYLNFKYDEKSNGIFYLADYSSNNGGTLKRYINGETVKISDDVYDYALLPSGDIAYLYDYSSERMKGDLRLYNGTESVKIDDDVSSIVSGEDTGANPKRFMTIGSWY